MPGMDPEAYAKLKAAVAPKIAALKAKKLAEAQKLAESQSDYDPEVDLFGRFGPAITIEEICASLDRLRDQIKSETETKD